MYAAAAKSHQSCPTLCDPVDGSPPGSPVPGILQARALEWGAVAFSEHNTTDFKTWNTTRKKKKIGHFITIKESTHQEEIAILNVYFLDKNCKTQERNTFKIQNLVKDSIRTLVTQQDILTLL